MFFIKLISKQQFAIKYNCQVLESSSMRKSLLSILYLSLTLTISSNVAAGEITILGLPISELLTNSHTTVSVKPDPRNVTVLKIYANGTIDAKPGSTHFPGNDYIPSTSQESLSNPESPLTNAPIKLTKLKLEPLVKFETLEDGKIGLHFDHGLITSITFRPVKNPEAISTGFLWRGSSETQNDSCQYICCAGFSKIMLELNLDALAKLVAAQSTP
jgi:hypothetical protein